MHQTQRQPHRAAIRMSLLISALAFCTSIMAEPAPAFAAGENVTATVTTTSARYSLPGIPDTGGGKIHKNARIRLTCQIVPNPRGEGPLGDTEIWVRASDGFFISANAVTADISRLPDCKVGEVYSTDTGNHTNSRTFRANSATQYRLPFEAGKRVRITQGPGGEFSHNDTWNKTAVDFGDVGTNTRIVASADGIVQEAEQGTGGWAGAGLHVYLDHGQSNCTSYLHLSKIVVTRGQRVRRGQLLGISGMTGNANGPHLHWAGIDCATKRSKFIINTLEMGTSYPQGAYATSQNTPDEEPTPARARAFGDLDTEPDGIADVLGIEGNNMTAWMTRQWLSKSTLTTTGFKDFQWIGKTADRNNDGQSDLLGINTSGEMYSFMSDDKGTYWGGTTKVAQFNWSSMDLFTVIDDTNGDGLPEFIARQKGSNALYLYHMANKNGTMSYTHEQIGTNWGGIIGLTSIGKDLDVGGPTLIAISADGTLRRWYISGNQIKNADTISSLGAGIAYAFSPGDMDGDGRRDILAKHTDGTVTLHPYLGNGKWNTKREVGKNFQTVRVLG